MERRSLLARTLTPQTLRRLLVALTLLGLLCAGLALRRYTWTQTKHLRFQRDIVNAFYWGTQTLAEGHRALPAEESDSWRLFWRGYLGLYDRVEAQAYAGNYYLDYPPLRLLAMSFWAKQVRAKFPGAEDGTPEYVEPLLAVNTIVELITAIGIFLLVRRGIRRASGGTDSGLLHRLPPAERGWVCGLVAASVAWLEPSLILDAHAWPQWDSWILPFYLFAALAALRKRWFWCGCLLALGGMFKGQLLFVAPFFLLWPLWQKRWQRAGSFLAGFLATTALLVSPWILRTPQNWLIVGAGAVLFVGTFSYYRMRHRWIWAAGAVALLAFTVAVLRGGSFAWLKIGFLYGSERYPYLFISSCYNFPSLLAHWNFSLKGPFWSLHLGPFHPVFTLQWSLRLLYFGALTLCALGAARHARRRDPRLLIAFAAPWLLMFALLPQMHERYLVWGAVVSAVALGVSLRLTTLHFLFSILSAVMITQVLLMDKKFGPSLSTINFLDRTRPIPSCLLLICVGLYFHEVLSTRAPHFQRWPVRRVTEKPSLALAVAAEKA